MGHKAEFSIMCTSIEDQNSCSVYPIIHTLS